MKNYISRHMLSLCASVCPLVLLIGGYFCSGSGANKLIFIVFALLAVISAALFLYFDLKNWTDILKKAEQKKAENANKNAKTFTREADLQRELDSVSRKLEYSLAGKMRAEKELYEALNTRNENTQYIERTVSEDFCGVSFGKFRNSVDSWSSEALKYAADLIGNVNIEKNKDAELDFTAMRLNMENILCLSRLDQIRVSELNDDCHLGTLVRECMKRHAHILNEKRIGALRKGLEITVRSNRSMCAFALSQVISNAVSNTGEFGKIAISGKKHDGYVLISVEDSGIGCLPEETPHLFEPGFVTLEEQNSENPDAGMSLFLAKSAILKIGGTISAHSWYGKGTRIEITIPYSQEDLK